MRRWFRKKDKPVIEDKAGLPDDSGHPVKGVLNVVEYQDGLRRISLTGEMEPEGLMFELKRFFYENPERCPVCGMKQQTEKDTP
jgi:hypothetical protein